jgi:Kef-type K+ transport system membrane component KefB
METTHINISSPFMLTLGGILLVGLLLSTIAKRTFLPRATLLLMFGAIIGADALNLLPRLFVDRFGLIAELTLLVVGFLLGGKLTKASLHGHTGMSFSISICAAVLPAMAVFLGMIALGVAIPVALLLGCFAAATAPAAILDVVQESGIENRFSELLLLIVVLDDIWALLLFGIGMAIVTSLNGLAGEASFIGVVAWELGGAVIVGAAIGLPAAYLTGRIKQGKPMLSEALGIVLLCGGVALWLNVSFLIAVIVMGAVVANLARHHDYPFHAIEGIQSLFMIVFFVLAGASLEFDAFVAIGVVGAVYILCRALGKYLGAWVGGYLSNSGQDNRLWMGVALLPQAGVAIGMALVASNRFPEYRQIMLPIVIASTIVFEIIGPVFTRLAIHRASPD